MPQPPAVRRSRAVVARGVGGRLLRRVDGRVRGGVAAGDRQVDVADRDAGDRVAGQAGDRAGERPVVTQAGAGHVVDADAADGARAGVAGAAAAVADLEVDRGGGVRHVDVVVGDVRDVRAVHRHDADARLAGLGDRVIAEVHVAEVAAGLRTELQRVVAGGGDRRAGDVDVRARERLAQREVALEYERVVAGGDVGRGDRHVRGVDDVEAVAVRGGGDGQVVDRDLVAAVEQDAEVAAALDGDAGERQAVDDGEGDGLVGLAGADAAGLQVARAVNGARAGERDVGEVLSPDQRVVEVAVAEVLVLREGVRLGRVEAAGGGADGGAGIELDVDVALEVDRDRLVGAGRELDDPAAGRRARGGDGLVDRRGVDGGAVALRAEGLHVEDLRGGLAGG